MPPMEGATEHTVHTDVLVAHVVLEKEPVGHVPEHAAVVSPVVAPYVPEGQHVHAGEVAPPSEYEPARQGPVQADEFRPVVAPYTPAGQGVHAEVVAPPDEYDPMGHRPEHAGVVSPVYAP